MEAAELRQLTFLKGECLDAMHQVWDDANSTYHEAVKACAGLTWTEEELEAAKATNWSRHWECHHAFHASVVARQKHERLHHGNCTEESSEEGFMHCRITQVFGELDYSRTQCLPDICEPQNVLMDGLEMEDKVESCHNGTQACITKVKCDGHEELDGHGGPA